MNGRGFQLHRDHDVSGVSGEGVVADGICYDEAYPVYLPDATLEMPAGWCVIAWRGEHRSTVLWASVESAIAVHGHHGATRLVWTDDD